MISYKCLFLIYFICKLCNCLNIALHAQLHPDNGKVVGSVITTDGLLTALLLRNDVDIVKIFYPDHYDGFYDVIWDFIFIEGWFPSINHFVWISKSYNHKVLIFFYCLDPSYPSLNITSSLDVDGYFTNSKYLSEKFLNYVKPTYFLLLAADVDKMKPSQTDRLYKSVYVGAGGPMIQSKKFLFDTLTNASTLGSLAIFGSNWEKYDELLPFYHGILSRNNISDVYSSSNTVIASTIDSQREYGMINNRIFEALSCGAIVISELYEELYQLFGDTIIYINNSYEIVNVINFVSTNTETMDIKRQKSRETILNDHTWNHRIIEILQFYYQLKEDKFLSNKRFYESSTSVAIVVSNEIINLPDYIIFQTLLLEYLNDIQYNYIIYSEIEFNYLLNQSCFINFDSITCNYENLNEYDLIMIISFPFSKLDELFMNVIPRIIYTKSNKFNIQRRIFFVFGVDINQLPTESNRNKYIENYDVLFYRNLYDINILINYNYNINYYRIQNIHGVEVTFDDKQLDPKYQLFVCTIEFINLCNFTIIQNFVINLHEIQIILVGGSYDNWNKYSNLFKPIKEFRISNILLLSIKSAYFYFGKNLSDYKKIILLIDYNQRNQQTYMNNIWLLTQIIISKIPLVLYSSNSYIDALLYNSEIQLSDKKYLFNSFKLGFIRAFSFSLSITSVNVIPINMYSNSLSLNCLESLQKASINVYSIQYQYFRPGYDGECCILYNSKVIRCMVWEFQYLGIIIQNSSTRDNNSSIVTIGLRGNMIQDLYYNTNITLTKKSSNELFDAKNCHEMEIFFIYL